MSNTPYPIENFAQTKSIPSHAKKVFKGHTFSVWQWEQKCYDGTVAIYERVQRPDYAFAVGVLPDQKIMLVEDEQPDRGTVLTPAGGGVEEGEDPAHAAARELLEETGYQAQEMVHWHSYRPDNRIEMISYGFIARGIQYKEPPRPEAGEKIKPVFFSFDEFIDLGKNTHLRGWMMRTILLEAQIDPVKKEKIRSLFFG